MTAPLPLEYRKTIWTPESTATLKALWAEGLSAAEIVPRINGGVTRNAVIGKLFRLGLPPRDALLLTWRQRVPMQTPRIAQKPRPKRTPEEQARRSARRKEIRAAKRLELTLAPLPRPKGYMRGERQPPRYALSMASPDYAGEPVSIIEVTGCKYAVSEGREHHFCNAPSDGPWCEFHKAVVWRPL